MLLLLLLLLMLLLLLLAIACILRRTIDTGIEIVRTKKDKRTDENEDKDSA
jgi:uncharacterized membrane protein affecting hemolysin expression